MPPPSPAFQAIGDAHLAAWSYPQACAEVGRIPDFVSLEPDFEPDMVSVRLDGTQLRLEPGQSVIAAQGPNRDLTVAHVLPPRSAFG